MLCLDWIEHTQHGKGSSIKGSGTVSILNILSLDKSLGCQYIGHSLSIVSDYRLDDRGLIPYRGRGFFFLPLRPDRLWGPPSLLCNGYQGGRGVMLTTHPHLVLRLRMSRSYTSSHPMRLHGM
jgi:hypothetical protein